MHGKIVTSSSIGCAVTRRAMPDGGAGESDDIFFDLRAPPDEDDDEERDSDGNSSDCMLSRVETR